MQRTNLEPTFTDLTLAELRGPRAWAFFDRCDREIPFDRLADAVADVFADDNPSGGAPHWPVVTLVKILFLQKCFGLWDPMAEEMLQDPGGASVSAAPGVRRPLLRRQDPRFPDPSTIALIRQRLNARGHGVTLFDTALQILRDRGLVMNTGTIIDASIMEAPLGGKRKDGASTADPAATKTVKGGRAYHGHRVHLATDRPRGGASSPTMCRRERARALRPPGAERDEAGAGRQRLPKRGADREAAFARGDGGVVPSAGAWAEGVDADAEADEPSDRAAAGVRGAPVRVEKIFHHGEHGDHGEA